MKKTRISKSQIVSAIKQHESGKSTADICGELGVHQATFYNWKKKYSGMDSQELRRMKELEEENRRLKQMYADLALDHKISLITMLPLPFLNGCFNKLEPAN